MDTVSTSSSSSAPAQGQKTLQPTYTTAGTVYKPQSAASIQPPARRGRALRWPPAIPSDLSSFHKSVLGSFPNRGYRSPPTTASSLKHYSPLQQNCERAAHPYTRPSDPKRNTSDSSTNMSLSDSFMRKSLSEHDVNGRSDLTTCVDNEDNKEEEELAQMSNYSVKALTSLASYPNPAQKMAQRALDRARETFKAATEMSRPASPDTYRRGLDASGARPPTASFGRDGLDCFSRVPRNGHTNSSTRSSVLSNGPGAPQPLTAGPPGHRQYKTSTFDGAFRVLNPTSQPPSSTAIDEAHFDINPSSLVNLGTQSPVKMPVLPKTPERKIRPRSTNEGFNRGKACLPNARGRMITSSSARYHSQIRDTLPVEAANEYYPHGLPADYNSAAIASVPANCADLVPKPDRRLPLSLEMQNVRDARHRAAFYAGRRNFFKGWEEITADLDEKMQHDLNGNENSLDSTSSRPNTDLQNEVEFALDCAEFGKPRDDVLVEDFSNLETCEAAKPLLNMAFLTLLSYQDSHVMENSTIFKQAPKAETGEATALSTECKTGSYRRSSDQRNFGSIG